MKVSLSTKTEKLLEDRMRAGEYSSPDELIQVALEAMDCGEYDDLDQETRAAIERADQQAEHGGGIPVDEAFSRLRIKHLGRQTSQEYRVIILPEAFDDLDRIIDFVASNSYQNAAATIGQLYRAALSLGTFPRRYKVYRSSKDPRRTVHAMPCPPYVIYYRVIEKPPTVRVLTVRHGARRQPKRFRS